MKYPAIHDLEHGITVVDTHYHGPNFAASHLLVESGQAAFIDVGTGQSAPYLQQALSRKGLGPEDVAYLILTHIHLDHAGGAGALMRQFPKAVAVVHPKGARHLVNPGKLVAAAIEVYGEEQFRNDYGTILPIPEERLLIAADGLVLDFQGRPLRFLDTPGHARHHLCIWDSRSGGMFSGDTMGLAFPALQLEGKPPFLIPTTSPAAFEPQQLAASIKRLEEFQPSCYFLTHYGPMIAGPDTVRGLLQMLEDHQELGRAARGDDLESLTELLLERYLEAFRNYTGGQGDPALAATLLGEDARLNAQGLLVWAARSMAPGSA